MTLDEQIRGLFPDAVNMADYILSMNDRNEGPFIVMWNEQRLGPKPTPEQLANSPGPPEWFPPLSRRQFFFMGALRHLIDEEEALAAVQHGEIPTVIEQFITQYVPQEQKFAARMLIAGAAEFDRRHPFVGQIAQALGLNKEQTDEFWREGAKL